MSTGRPAVPAGVRDRAIAGGVAATLLATGISGQNPATSPPLLGHVLLAAGGLALAARRRAPAPVLAVTGLCTSWVIFTSGWALAGPATVSASSLRRSSVPASSSPKATAGRRHAHTA